MEFKVGDRVRVCDGSADHWRVGVIDSIYLYTDTGNHLVLLDGEDECCGYSAHDLRLISQEVQRLVSQGSETVFKVGDRVEIINSNDAFAGRFGVVQRFYAEWDVFRVAIDGTGASVTYVVSELRHIPTAHTRGTHPKSLANLAPGQAPREGEWEEKRLRLSTDACDWLRKQGQGNMSRAVERLIMEKISKEEGEGS
jgi:hypothetical protein